MNKFSSCIKCGIEIIGDRSYSQDPETLYCVNY